MARPTYNGLPVALKRSIHIVALAALLTGVAWVALHFTVQGWIDEKISRPTAM